MDALIVEDSDALFLKPEWDWGCGERVGLELIKARLETGAYSEMVQNTDVKSILQVQFRRSQPLTWFASCAQAFENDMATMIRNTRNCQLHQSRTAQVANRLAGASASNSMQCAEMSVNCPHIFAVLTALP